ncbi:hypothetical protein DOTSEDRAFT_64422 [Dothistroma septosporum NZE10]|uniref:Uncharacterized protein n=1 Tax=Dothistroma septosporum (strain NZE10 / CBS 128990) TaxID=675120 RepID=N1PJT0_DOTSN|nr:hypothetical protein DOTSEDRAFT_64422 [Dothistroma septosporum NZE10]
MLNEVAANASASTGKLLFSDAALRNVDTYVHVVIAFAKVNRYSQAQIKSRSISVTKDAYASHSIAFSLGFYADLNLYFLADLGGGLLGFCYFPEVSPSSTNLILGGCVNLVDSLPNGSDKMERWFGIYRVVQGSSFSGSGDQVSNTSMQKTATGRCPSRQDSSLNARDVCTRAGSFYDQRRAGEKGFG